MTEKARGPFVSPEELRALLQGYLQKRRRGERPDHLMFDILDAISEVTRIASGEEIETLQPLINEYVDRVYEDARAMEADLQEAKKLCEQESLPKKEG